MKIYNPNGFNLPPIMIQKRQYRENIENDKKVKNIINTNLLLNKEFNKLYFNIFEKSKEIISLFSIKNYDIDKILELGFPRKILSEKTYKKYLRKSRHPSRLFNKQAQEDLISEMIRDTCKKIKRRLKEFNQRIEGSINEYEIEKNVNLDILSLSVVYLCKRCHKVISIDRFDKQKCICGEEINKISQTNQLPVHHFNNNMINFIENNYWLEFAVDYILKRKGLITLIGQEILGNSGVSHEIDNIAYCPNENFRFFCECKNADVKENDVFIFSGKMLDIGGTRGYIFTTAENTSENIKRLARSKNIDIIENVLNKDIYDLIQEIKE
jgi:hypothetical protein